MGNGKLTNARALDPKFYTDKAVYDQEKRGILTNNWQVVAPAELLSGAGDMISRHLGDVPILITRSPSGTLNGFYNICPHRAGPLATCDARGTKRLRCGYHGWAYNHEGQLKSEDITFTHQVQDEDKSICEHVQRGLTSGVYKPGRLCPAREAGVWHFHNLMRDAYKEAGLT